MERIHHRVLTLDRVEHLAWLVSSALAIVGVAIAVDWMIRWPLAIRAAFLVSGLALAIRAVRVIITRCWIQAPQVTSTALRVEGIEPSLAGLLATAVEFERDGRSEGLKAEVVARARAISDTVRIERHVRRWPASVASIACAGMAISMGTWMHMEPVGSGIGLRRTLTPWTSDQWLPRVGIETDLKPATVARGTQVPLRVVVTRGDRPDLRVRAICATRRSPDTRATDERVIDLVRQSDGSFERPILADGDLMSIRFEAGDATIDPRDIEVVTPPAIMAGSIEITPPPYASGERPTVRADWKGPSPTRLGAVLEGSLVRISLELEAPAADPSIEGSVRVTDAAGDPITAFDAQASSTRQWRITLSARRGEEIHVDPVGESGVRAPETLRIALEVLEDTAPSVLVVKPETDEIVTMDARIPFEVLARDDLGLSLVGWSLERQQRSGEPAPAQVGGESRAAGSIEDRLVHVIELGTLGTRAGDVLLLRGLAQDRHERDGARRPLIASEPRRLRVVDRETLERQVRQQTGALRQALVRLETAQRELIDRDGDASTARSQAGIAERTRQASTSAEELLQRMRRNGLSDVPLTETIGQATRITVDAANQADRSREALERAMKGDAGADTAAREGQQATAERLAEAIDLLDRDDEAASAQRQVDRLAEQVRKLREDLRETARRTAGRAIDELSSQDAQALQEQASRQQAAADEALAMIDDLRARADRAAARDPAQARSMRQAADEGEKGQAGRRLDEAAERTARNQTAAADQAMKAAAEAIDRVRESLREDRRARAEDLRRRLASLSETIRALVAAAEATLPRIGDEAPTVSLTSEMLRISDNTAAAGEDAREGDRAMALIASLLTRASERFDAAAGSLRAEAPDRMAAREAAVRGIDLLREAQNRVSQEIARRNDAAAERERAELARQCRDLAGRTRAVRETVASTIPKVGGRVDRRGAAVQREQAIVTESILKAFRSGPAASDVTRSAEAFQAVHRRVDGSLDGCVSSLAKADAGPGEVRRLDLVAGDLDSLAVALSDPEPGDEPFMQEGQQDGAGGGGQAAGQEPRLPPIAELRLVRQMQEQVNALTRTIEEARESGQAIDRELAEIAAMQDEVRRLGESWFERMKRSRDDGVGRSDRDSSDASGLPKFGFMRQSQTTAGTDDQATSTPGAAVPPSAGGTGKTLDELLGIAPSGSSDAAAQRRRDRRLERSLKREDLDDLASVAAESVAAATELVRDRRETGIEAQRAQAEALASIDALLDAATRFQRQQSRSSSRSRSQQDGQSQASGQRRQAEGDESRPTQERAGARQDGEGRERSGASSDGALEPPPPEEAIASSGVLEEGRSEWGALPQRVREIMSQARKDRVSALYQQATQEYYRRLAERRPE